MIVSDKMTTNKEKKEKGENKGKRKKNPKIQYSPPSLKDRAKSVQDNWRKNTRIYTRPDTYDLSFDMYFYLVFDLLLYCWVVKKLYRYIIIPVCLKANIKKEDKIK